MKQTHNKLYLKSIRKILRNNPTKAELLLWIKLKGLQTGFKFRRQHSIGNFVADFYCPKVKLVLELDGETHNDSEVLKNDDRKERFLRDKGFVVKRISNMEVLENVEGVAEMVKIWCNELYKNR
ncbi:MAG: cytosine methyltransferase [Parcubacteria group bacterium CG_4_9_14_0_2_um_filter_41_8]|nr:MAG: hypothetical protein AUJ34_02960 [Parcubacteria group bacterium CG1_02_41_12]PIP67171.1 MAG: cytosine methyltransferase [Parcubacteria group bacterium CG22_combo_CG10-13_8_21_14_all_41_9]PJC40711.1 MAG: cytosine methyltransferase [Parcubacteria group bacterium CG_4_9_14_0_2_um_filter_41_8]